MATPDDLEEFGGCQMSCLSRPARWNDLSRGAQNVDLEGVERLEEFAAKIPGFTFLACVAAAHTRAGAMPWPMSSRAN
jgi:hypothetical protein